MVFLLSLLLLVSSSVFAELPNGGLDLYLTEDCLNYSGDIQAWVSGQKSYVSGGVTFAYDGTAANPNSDTLCQIFDTNAPINVSVSVEKTDLGSSLVLYSPVVVSNDYTHTTVKVFVYDGLIGGIPAALREASSGEVVVHIYVNGKYCSSNCGRGCGDKAAKPQNRMKLIKHTFYQIPGK